MRRFANEEVNAREYNGFDRNPDRSQYHLENRTSVTARKSIGGEPEDETHPEDWRKPVTHFDFGFWILDCGFWIVGAGLVPARPSTKAGQGQALPLQSKIQNLKSKIS